MKGYQMIVTQTAKTKIAELIKAPNEVMSDYKFFLRITAIEDNGLKYQTYFDFEPRDEDSIFEFEGFNLRVDKESLEHLEPMTLHYSEEQGFYLDDLKK